MKTLYIDCGMGAAGDMLAGALLELMPEPDTFIRKLQEAGIPDVLFKAEKSVKCGIRGTHFDVSVAGIREGQGDQTYHHAGLRDIKTIVSGLRISTLVKLDVLSVYQSIAEAESHVHGVPVEQIHFHEVGTVDAIADITAVCMLMNELKPEQVIASAVHVGAGTVRCAHGILPVPAPATAYLLQQIPIYGGAIQGELCTPTGAALLKHFVTKFGDMPVMKVSAVGYGMGKKDFPRANCVRAMLGDTEDQAGRIAELSCNLDDMTPEAIGFAMEVLMEKGALDVFTTAIGMKKSRPGILLTVLCREDDTERFAQLIFRNTTTLGIRKQLCERYTLTRSMETVDTPYGPIRRKVSTGYGVERSKFEYEDLARAAKRSESSLYHVLDSLK